MPKPARIKVLQDKKAGLLKAANELLDGAQAEGRDGKLNETEAAAFEANRVERAALDKALALETELQEAERSMVVAADPPGRRGTRVGNARPACADDPLKGFKTPREFLAAVMDAGARGYAGGDERLQYLATSGSDEAGEYSEPYGGFLVPEGFVDEMLMVTPEADPMGGRVTEVPMESPVVGIPARTDKNHTTSVAGGLIVTRHPETMDLTSSRMQMEAVRLHATSLFGLSFATEEILTDSRLSFLAILEKGFQQQFIYQLINERLNGTGAGEFLGVMNSPCLITVAKDNAQTAATISGTNVLNMRAQCWGYGDAIWLANHDCLPQLAQVHIDNANGFPITLYHMSDTEDVPDTLLGRPIKYTEYCQTLGTAGDLVLGNWSEYLEGEYQPLDTAESIHVRFLQHERTFKFWLRNAGAPWWRTALTPKYSAKTLSPFVTLATRA
jgi:HK97 family phage major capsid protein